MVTISIAGTDRSNFVVWNSLRIENILTKQVDKCNFVIRNPDKTGTSFIPLMGRQVIIEDSGTRIFGGVIVRITERSPVVGVIEYSVECSDFTRLLDQHLVAETYENQTVDQIIADIVANWLPSGFTTTQVDASVTVDYIQFKYEPVSDCLRQLADIVGYDYFIDYDKDIYFKSPIANPAPFDITDTSGTYVHDSLVIRRDNSQLRNSILVRGGEYEGTQFTASVRADGRQIVFNLPYKYHDFAATLTGHRLTIGVDYLDDPNSYDALYNFNEKLLRFKESDRPNQNATLSFSGKPLLPVVVRVRDSIAIADTLSAEGQADGTYEYLVVDKSINTQVSARERAAAEMRTYGETLSEGEFETESSGLRAGMKIRIDSDLRGLDEEFIINRVNSQMKSPNEMLYKISLITTKTFDFISLLKKLLLAENKKIVITDDELLNLVESPTETLTITDAVFTGQPHPRSTETLTLGEAFTPQALDYGVQFVLGPYAPTGTKRVFILNGSNLG